MAFFEKILLQSCILHKNIFTEAHIHQQSAAGKSAARFNSVNFHLGVWLFLAVFQDRFAPMRKLDLTSLGPV